MDDLTICRKIADIEDVHYIETQYKENNFLALVSENDFTGTPPEMIGKYDPLNDDALCFQLMVGHGVLRDLCEEGYRAVMPKWNGTPEYYRITDKNPNKAICLAIIEANNETIK